LDWGILAGFGVFHIGGRGVHGVDFYGKPFRRYLHLLPSYKDPESPWGAPLSEPITFAGTPLGEYRHICAFFHTPDEMYRTLMPFIQDGFKRGDRAFHIVDGRNWDDHVTRLNKAGIEAEKAMERGQLEVRNWHQAYLRDGHFSQDRMLELIEEVLQAGPKQGYEITRLMAHMEWALEDMPGVDDLVEYETRLNYVLPRYKDPVI
jgi:hypothetical protein